MVASTLFSVILLTAQAYGAVWHQHAASDTPAITVIGSSASAVARFKRADTTTVTTTFTPTTTTTPTITVTATATTSTVTTTITTTTTVTPATTTTTTTVTPTFTSTPTSTVTVTGGTSTVTTTSTTTITVTPTTTTTTTTTTSTTTTTTAGPVVTDEAYIDTVLRHHNVHRVNHTAPALVWSPSLANTARKIAESCVYQHDTTTDGGGYGQNIGAGFPSTAMGQFITEGLYNPEVNFYTYYGGEPDTSTVGQWGHFSQIVWVSTTAVGCYTNDCSATGLQNAPGIPPFFSVCNYAPAGNVIGAFGANVLAPVGNPTVFANYECPSAANCVGPTQ